VWLILKSRFQSDVSLQQKVDQVTALGNPEAKTGRVTSYHMPSSLLLTKCRAALIKLGSAMTISMNQHNGAGGERSSSCTMISLHMAWSMLKRRNLAGRHVVGLGTR
jgi:hypothetical protein